MKYNSTIKHWCASQTFLRSKAFCFLHLPGQVLETALSCQSIFFSTGWGEGGGVPLAETRVYHLLPRETAHIQCLINIRVDIKAPRPQLEVTGMANPVPVLPLGLTKIGRGTCLIAPLVPLLNPVCFPSLPKLLILRALSTGYPASSSSSLLRESKLWEVTDKPYKTEDLKTILLSERNQTQKSTCFVIPCLELLDGKN